MRSVALRTRLTIWYSVALLFVLAVFAATVAWQQSRIGTRRVDRELDDLSATLGNVLRDELGEMPDPNAAAVEALRTLQVHDRATAILDEDGRTLAASWNGLRLSNAPRAADGARVWTETAAGAAWRVHVRPEFIDDRRFVLALAAPLDDVYRERREALEAMWIGIPIALMLAAAGGLWLATVGLRPIRDMAHKAARLAPSGLDDLGQPDRQDELGQLARAFNDLVARLRHSLQTQRQFMADASHELRTPVSVVQTAADVGLAREHRTEAEYREALGIVGTQARRLGGLVEDMLVLARADAGGYPLRRVGLYLNELVAECAHTVGVLARARGVSVCASANCDVPFSGDEDLLRRMLINIVQNAVQHTRSDSTVRVALSPNGRGVAIRVQDEGHGISEGNRERIFDRFVQLDAARRGAGAGLGLPIARWIAEAHGGTLDLEASDASGSTFRIVLPLDSPLAGRAAQESTDRF